MNVKITTDRCKADVRTAHYVASVTKNGTVELGYLIRYDYWNAWEVYAYGANDSMNAQYRGRAQTKDEGVNMILDTPGLPA